MTAPPSEPQRDPLDVIERALRVYPEAHLFKAALSALARLREERNERKLLDELHLMRLSLMEVEEITADEARERQLLTLRADLRAARARLDAAEAVVEELRRHRALAARVARSRNGCLCSQFPETCLRCIAITRRDSAAAALATYAAAAAVGDDDRPIRCATFDAEAQDTIPPEIRAHMDADRKKAEEKTDG